MVQDNRASYYYYSFMMKRPFKADQPFLMNRWGNINTEELEEDALENHEYLKVMLDREQIICVPVPGLTGWAKKLESPIEQIDLMVDHKSDFKLGEMINVVAFYYPDHKKLYYVRRAAEEEVEKVNLNPLVNLKNAEVDFEKTHH